MGIDTLRRSRRHESADVGPRLDGHRRELRSHCRRMLGSGLEADDAVQETLVRAWRAFDRFENRSSLRTWLYRIATNVCLDMMQGQQRRPRPVDLDLDRGPSPVDGAAETAVGRPSGDMTTDPAEVVTSREAVHQALLVALQTLPPRQRAVLILRDVLRWRTDEVAELLGSTETSVRSALQRARTSLAANAGATAARSEIEGPQRHLLARYVDAFERSDVRALVALLRLDHLGPTHDQGSVAKVARVS